MSLASRPFRPGVGLHPRPVGRRRHRRSTSPSTAARCGCRTAPRADPVGQLRRRLADGLEHGITLVTAKAALGLLETDPSGAAVVATALDYGARYRRRGLGQRAHRARGDGQRPAPPRPGRPSAGPRARLGLRQPRHAGPRAPLRRVAARVDASCRRAGSPTGTGGSSTPGRPTPPSGCWRPPWPAAAVADAEAMMFTAVTDHVFIDERPHARLHEQGVRGAGSGRGRPRRRPCCRRWSARPAPPTAARSRRSGATRATSPVWRRRRSKASTRRVEKGWATPAPFTDVAGLAWAHPRRRPRRGRRCRGRRHRHRRHARAARSSAGLRRGAADRAVPHPERLRRLELGPPRVHGRPTPCTRR